MPIVGEFLMVGKSAFSFFPPPLQLHSYFGTDPVSATFSLPGTEMRVR
jgi:hypothetical protein